MIGKLNRFFIVFILIMFSFQASAKSIPISSTNILKADKIYYNAEEDFAEAIGNVRILNGNQYIRADKALIDLKTKEIWATGSIYGQTHKQKILANSIFLSQKNDTALANNVKLRLNDDEVLVAKLLVKKNENESEVYQGVYTPCQVCIYNKPIWQIDAKKTSLDFKNNTISYQHAVFKVAGHRVLFLPYFSHSMPNAKAKSGILRPEIDKGTLKIPFYYLVKPNMDFTYTPRFNRKLFIHELEYRHLIESGFYQFNGNYTRSQISKKTDEEVTYSKKYHRYNINSLGNFATDHTHYGYNIGKVSDKSYLKNYYQDNRSFIKSEVYLDYFLYNGYNHFDVQHYQGLRTDDDIHTDPSALPNIDFRRDYELDLFGNLKVEDQALQYVQGNIKNISRNSLDLDFTKTFFGNAGQSLTAGFHNRTDIYRIEKANYVNNNLIYNKNLFRNIPELKTNLRWPLFLTASTKVLVLEPEVNFIVGRKNSGKINNYNLIDSPNYEINENNIFENSRYSGIDFYEFGRRFSYGLNNYIMGDNWQVSAFLGQLIRSELGTSDSKSDYIGKVSYNYSDNFELYYRFQRKKKHLEPYRDEIAAWINFDKLSIKNNWIALRDLKEYAKYYDLSSYLTTNIIKQNYTKISYQLTDNMSLFGDIRFDFSKKNKPKSISDSIGTSYKLDCIAFTIKISNDYTNDPSRDIKKTRTYSFKLGLKTVNM